MNASKLSFKPRFTPIPPDLDIHALVRETTNFQWAPREDSRLHSAPFHKLSQIVHSVTVDQGIPIVVDNWHLRHDWNPSLFSQEWLNRTHGKEGKNHSCFCAYCRNFCERLVEMSRYKNVSVFVPFANPKFSRSRCSNRSRFKGESSSETLCEGYGLSCRMAGGSCSSTASRIQL